MMIPSLASALVLPFKFPSQATATPEATLMGSSICPDEVCHEVGGLSRPLGCLTFCYLNPKGTLLPCPGLVPDTCTFSAGLDHHGHILWALEPRSLFFAHVKAAIQNVSLDTPMSFFILCHSPSYHIIFNTARTQIKSRISGPSRRPPVGC